MERIKVSIIMPSLNVFPYIEECIKSAAHQTLEEIEIICVDAGSTDGTLEVLEKYKKSDDRIKIVNFKRKSYGAQVNHGISISRGEYIAILETDDFVDQSMYESLYDAAAKYHAEYAKADYKKFFALENGEYLYSVIRQFEKENIRFYGKLLNPHTFDELYKTDYNIWKGIYRRDFILQNQIRLTESDGAAYQDIGFMEKVMAAATRAVYLDKPCYHYRVDRDDASSYSIYGLKNTQFEFQKLIEDFHGGGKVYWRGFYLHMMTAFLNEYEKTLKKTGFACETPECSDYYSWFADHISWAMRKGLIAVRDIDRKYTYKFELLLRNPQTFAEFLKSDRNRFEEYVENLVFEQPVQIMIFGAGYWGYEALKMLREKKNCQIQAFIDNDEEKQGIAVDKVEIHSLKQALCKFPTAAILIANEKYYPEIREQIEKESDGHRIWCPFE